MCIRDTGSESTPLVGPNKAERHGPGRNCALGQSEAEGNGSSKVFGNSGNILYFMLACKMQEVQIRASYNSADPARVVLKIVVFGHHRVKATVSATRHKSILDEVGTKAIGRIGVRVASSCGSKGKIDASLSRHRSRLQRHGYEAKQSRCSSKHCWRMEQIHVKGKARPLRPKQSPLTFYRYQQMALIYLPAALRFNE